VDCWNTADCWCLLIFWWNMVTCFCWCAPYHMTGTLINTWFLKWAPCPWWVRNGLLFSLIGLDFMGALFYFISQKVSLFVLCMCDVCAVSLFVLLLLLVNLTLVTWCSGGSSCCLRALPWNVVVWKPGFLALSLWGWLWQTSYEPVRGVVLPLLGFLKGGVPQEVAQELDYQDTQKGYCQPFSSSLENFVLGYRI
jgi:hypothetical protein